MNIAIIGAGFCGLAVAWHLSQFEKIHITLFDPIEIGKGTSGISAGLLHPFAGAFAKKNWLGDEGMAATIKLIEKAEEALNFPVRLSTGLLRFATTSQQQRDFRNCANQNSEVHWWSIDKCQNSVQGISPFPGIFISSALTIDCELYLKGLWKACQKNGVLLKQVQICTLFDLKEYDHIIITAGAATALIPECSHLPITPVKGQIIESEWPLDFPELQYPVNSQAYLIKNIKNHSCIMGATFEKEFKDFSPNLQVALHGILPKVNVYFPHFKSSHITGCRAGIRASTPNHKPIMLNFQSKHWVLTGMGSKGLLYHALFAQKLVQKLMTHQI